MERLNVELDIPDPNSVFLKFHLIKQLSGTTIYYKTMLHNESIKIQIV